MKFIYIVFLFGLLVSCNQGNKTATSTSSLNLDGFEQKDLGNNVIKVGKYTSDRVPLEKGYLSNGIRNGIWTIHWPENGRIKILTPYVNDKKNGEQLEFNNRGQVETKSTFVNDVLNGYYATYKFGRTEMDCYFKNGQYHGDYKEYFKSGSKAGALQKLVQYKDGKQHGKLSYFDEDGNLKMEYIYKNGEKISGGIVK